MEQDNKQHEPKIIGDILKEMAKDPKSIIFRLNQWRAKHGK
jgi:hypothetical protein